MVSERDSRRDVAGCQRPIEDSKEGTRCEGNLVLCGSGDGKSRVDKLWKMMFGFGLRIVNQDLT